jgi:outer membrane murein-binding lipoprotein Lpp
MRLVIAAILLFAAASAQADGRFVLSASRDGIVRLDTATGAVSRCSPSKGVWRCEPLAIESARLDALATEVAALTAKVAALSSSLAGAQAAVKAAPPAPVVVAVEPGPVATPAEPTRPNLVREVVGRFLALVRTLKHGRDDA